MASGQTQVSAETIEKTKQQIRGLVGEIAQLSKSDLGPEEFYSAFLQRVVQALAAVGGPCGCWAKAKSRSSPIKSTSARSCSTKSRKTPTSTSACSITS